MAWQYRLVRRLDQGAFGEVYLAVQEPSGRQVAIKFLKNANDYDRFRLEVQNLWQQLDNQFVVDLVDANLTVTPPFFVMEYCAHGSLRSWVGKGKNWTDVVGVLSHVAVGLHKLHERGGIHRDLKPENLLLTENQRKKIVAKLSDFGLARIPDPRTGFTCTPRGTRAYMAPELFTGADFTQSADIYSFGLVALELATGSRDPAKLTTASMPDQFRAMTRSMLNPIPDRRPSAADVAATLRQVGVALGSQPKKKKSTWGWWVAAAAGAAVLLLGGRKR